MGNAPPRKAPVGNQARPIYLFTDGACEPDSEAPFYMSASYEAVLYAPEDGALKTFGGYLPGDILNILTECSVTRQVVGQLELAPCVVDKDCWKKGLCGTDGAGKFAFIKGTSPTRNSAWLVQQFWEGDPSWDCFLGLTFAPTTRPA